MTIKNIIKPITNIFLKKGRMDEAGGKFYKKVLIIFLVIPLFVLASILVLNANFTNNGDDQYTLTYTSGENGSISGPSPQTVTKGSNGTEVIALPDTGYHFYKWSDNNSYSATRTDLNVQSNINTTALFESNSQSTTQTFTLTYTAGANGSITGTTPQTVNYDTSGTAVTAVPAIGYHFVKWSDNSTASPRTDTNVKANISVTATFEIDPVTTFTIIPSANTGCTITPSTVETINYGSNSTLYSFSATTGYTLNGYSIDNNPTTAGTTYSFANITANHTIQARCTLSLFTLTYTAGANGSIVGDSPQTVNYGANGSLVTATPSLGYHFVSWSDSYPTAARTDLNVTTDITVSATFGIDPATTFTITPSANTGCTITPNTVETISSGLNSSLYSFSAATGYTLNGYSIDGGPVIAGSSYTFINVTSNHTIQGICTINTFTITASSGANGSVTPSGVTTKDYGTSQLYTITPSLGYHITDVLVDTLSIGITGTYTFTDIQANHTISATFATNYVPPPPVVYHNIYVSTETNAPEGTPQGGTITPSGTTSVQSGNNQTFVIGVETNFKITDLIVDGNSLGSLPSYTFYNVRWNHTIKAIFTRQYTITTDTNNHGAITPSTSPQTVTYDTTYTLSLIHI